jgi:hypothetical protein
VKVLVFAHRLELGGSQINAIELASEVRDRYGHDVVLFATPGPARELALRRGLRVLDAPVGSDRPSARRMVALRRAVRDERADLVHAWDLPQGIEAFFGVHLGSGLPLACSMMSMTVPSKLPRSVPATFGSPALSDAAARGRSGSVALLEPPVDLRQNHRDALAADAVREFRRDNGLHDGCVDIVVVSRLVEWMKLEGIVGAIEAVTAISPTTRARLVVVGEGSALERVRELADRGNALLGDRRIVITGGMVDPRPAYAAADIVLGMGGSALRAMAFSRPLIVLGEQGYSEIFRPETAPTFLRDGFYGIGDGSPVADRLEQQLRWMLSAPHERRRLGQYGRQVVDRFGLARAAARVDRLYREAVERQPTRRERWADAARTAAVLVAGPVVPERVKVGRVPQPVVAS